MAEQNQIIVEPVPETGASKGSRVEVNLRASFAGSPIYDSSLTNAERKDFYQKQILDATIVNGNGFNSVDMNFTDAPNLDDVDLNTHNIPSPYMPNPTSPGPGSVNPADKPAYTGNVMDPALNVEFGTGLGGTTSPSETATEISKQGPAIGSYISGKSYPGSNGQP